MDPKAWLSLRQIYRNRFSSAVTKMDSKLSLARCREGVRMCCGRVGSVVGAALVLLGLMQVTAGVYWMPALWLGSNIWAGSWSGVCGTVVCVIGWRKQVRRRGQTVLVATLSVLVANVANLVILQVGENGAFLSEDDVRINVEENQDATFRIAFWLTTALTAVGVVVSFFGAQYLFCVVIRGPKKGSLPASEEGLHQQKQEIHDSRPSLEDVVTLPDPGGSSAWVYLPQEENSPTLLQSMGLDIFSDFSICSRPLPARHASFATSRYARVSQRPQRAQSFATQRGLKISNNLPRNLPPTMCPEPTSSRLSSHYARANARRIHRSHSVSDRMLMEECNEGANLSRKFRTCSLDELEGGPGIEVGMLSRERSRSEHGLHEPPTDGTGTVHIQLTANTQQRLFVGIPVLTSFGPVNHPAALGIKPKGLAPRPPAKPKLIPPSPIAQSVLSTKQNDEKEIRDASTTAIINLKEEEKRTQNKTLNNSDEPTEITQNQEDIGRELRPSSVAKQVSTPERHILLPVLVENVKNVRKRLAPQPRSFLLTQSDDESSKETSVARESGKLKPARREIVKPLRSSLRERPPHLVNENTAVTHLCPVKKTKGKQPESVTVDNLRRLGEVLTDILDPGETVSLRATKSDEDVMESLKAINPKLPKSILKKASNRPSKYEAAHREALEDSKVLLDQLSCSELQRNKIVLRVPSFRTAGCQTESCRPVRHRASCAQTNLSAAPRYETTGSIITSSITSSRATPTERRPNLERRNNPNETPVMESSSSGYSSPEVNSKDPTPAHSCPPSPASSSVAARDEDHRRHDTSVTVTEVNKSETVKDLDPFPPPRPPKLLRLRCMSDSTAVAGGHEGFLVPVQPPTSQLPLYEDAFRLTALTENIMLLTEAINPVLVHSTSDGGDAPSSPMPRVFDVIRKTTRPSPQDDRTWNGRTTLVPGPLPDIRPRSLSLPRPSHTPTLLPRGPCSPSPSRSQQEGKDEGSSTAAYLASLELLASHYRIKQ